MKGKIIVCVLQYCSVVGCIVVCVCVCKKGVECCKISINVLRQKCKMVKMICMSCERGGWNVLCCFGEFHA